jgi:hypothetical protein
MPCRSMMARCLLIGSASISLPCCDARYAYEHDNKEEQGKVKRRTHACARW